MIKLIKLWKPTNKFLLLIKGLLLVVVYITFIASLILPFMGSIRLTKAIFQWLWIGLLLINLDRILLYKKKLLTPIISLFVTLSLIYLHTYWGLISEYIIICCSIIVCGWELFILIALNKGLQFSIKTKIIHVSTLVLKNLLLGVIYITVILLIILGILNNNRDLFFIFASLDIILLSIGVAINVSNLFKSRINNIFDFVYFALYLISIIALVIYSIFSIKNKDLQTILLSIASALISGFLTLLGVAWTIKRGEKNSYDNLCKKVVPYLNLIKSNIESADNINVVEHCAFPQFNFDEGNSKNYFEFDSFYIKNISKTCLLLVGIVMEKKYVEFNNNQLLEPNTAVKIDATDLCYITKEKYAVLKLIVQDLLKNFYSFEFELECFIVDNSPMKARCSAKRISLPKPLKDKFILDEIKKNGTFV